MDIRTATHYRNLAMELRAIAEWKLDVKCRAMSLRIADQYESLAQAAGLIERLRADTAAQDLSSSRNAPGLGIATPNSG